MADGEEKCIDAAVAPPNDVATVEVEGIEQGVEVVDDLFEGQGIQ